MEICERTDFLMGTVIEQKVIGRKAKKTARAVSRELERMHSQWSVFEPKSELSRLNALAGKRPLRIRADTFALLQIAEDIREKSGGAFDIAVGPLLKLWRGAEKTNTVPSAESISAAKELMRETKMTSNVFEAFLPQAGQELDLGGIGKGFAADFARETYRERNIESAMINLGGNVIVTGRKPDGSLWRIGIQDPNSADGGMAGWLETEERSVVTSGGYNRFFTIGGKTYPHIIDPRTGFPAETDIAGVTIVHYSSSVADGLATAVYVLGSREGLRLVDSVPDCGALVILNDGGIRLNLVMDGLFRKT